MPTRATVLALLCAALCAPLALAQSSPAPENIQLTISVAAERDGKPEQARTFSLVCRSGEPTKLTVGTRFPIPATTFNAGSEKGVTPVTSFTYQNVGFVASLKCDRLKDGRIVVEGGYDDSSLRGPAPGAPEQPIVTTFSQELNVLLVPGKPLTVARFSDIKGAVTSLTIEAKPLD
jgi:hypothetical protein